jgi:subtilisin family serine protease
LLALAPGPAATATPAPPLADPGVLTHPKVEPLLRSLLPSLDPAWGTLRVAARARRGWAIEGGPARLAATGLRVYLEVAAVPPTLAAELAARGGSLELVDPAGRLIQASVPPARLGEVADLPWVRLVRLPDYGVAAGTGAVETEGEPVIGADLARREFGLDGAGIRVGVISDGILGVEESMASGDLPEAGAARSFRADGDLFAGAEGTALLEIVHDLAPGASLFFAGISTSLEFIEAVRWLSDEAGGANPRRGTPGGVDVLVQDFGFFNAGPYDGSSPVSQALTRAAAGGVVVLGAAGNQARSHYRGGFRDSDGDTFHEFDLSLGLPRSNDGGETLDVRVLPGETVLVLLQWDDPFGASGNDYDLCAHDPADQPAGDPVVCSLRVQDGDDDPVERLIVTRPAAAPSAGVLGIRIDNFLGLAAPRTFQLFVLGGEMTEFVVPEGSIPNAADARDALAVGAVDWRFPGVVQAFSSRGPTADGRLKPDLVAPDGVSVTGAGGFPTPFFGTSAAAPHAAAVAALVLQGQPDLLPFQVRSTLAFAAADLAPAGLDPASGNGLVRAERAVRLAAAGRATFSFDSGELHLPAVRLPDGRLIAALARQVPGAAPLTGDLARAVGVAAAPGPEVADLDPVAGVLRIPAVELRDGRVLRVELGRLPGAAERWELLDAAPVLAP